MEVKLWGGTKGCLRGGDNCLNARASSMGKLRKKARGRCARLAQGQPQPQLLPPPHLPCPVLWENERLASCWEETTQQGLLEPCCRGM